MVVVEIDGSSSQLNHVHVLEAKQTRLSDGLDVEAKVKMGITEGVPD